MPRPARADEAGGLYQALNRGKHRTTIFHPEGDIAAFEKILSEGLETYQVELTSDQFMPNHDHLVLRPLVDGEMCRFMKWMGGTQTILGRPRRPTAVGTGVRSGAPLPAERMSLGGRGVGRIDDRHD